jgi:molybdate transport system substrate-binding protein
MRRLVLTIALLAFSAGALAGEALVAAAADLSLALRDIAALYRKESGRAVKLSFGSSGNFRHQIAAGAPFELFLSADEDYVLALARESRTIDEGVLYAVGRIVLFAPHGSPVEPDPEMAGLGRALAAGVVRRFAIANPEHAPYGRAAREALQKLGLWEALAGRLVFGENASQAAQFAASADAQGGIIPYSLALAPNLSKRGRYALLPEALHRPLRQRMALLRGAGEPAREFYRYLQQPPARAILARYGFALPGE